MKITQYSREYAYVYGKLQQKRFNEEDYTIGKFLVQKCHEINSYNFLWDENGLFSINLTTCERATKETYQRLVVIRSQPNQDPPKGLVTLLEQHGFRKLEPPAT